MDCKVVFLMTFVVWTSTAGSQDGNLNDRVAKLEEIVSKLAVRLEGVVSGMADKIQQIENVVHEFLIALETVEIPHAGCFTLFQALGSREHDDAGKDSSQGALDKRQVNLQAAVTGANLNGQLQNISVNGIVSLLRGKDGREGRNGTDGLPGAPGRNGSDGSPGAPGMIGTQGPTGTPGLNGTCSKSQCQGPEPYQTYWSQDNVHSYLRFTNLPALTEMTMCFYYEPDPAYRLSGSHLISIASPGKDNAFLLFVYYGGKGVMLHLGSESDVNRIELQSEAFEKGHRHCLVWKRLQSFKWFYDMKEPGVLEFAEQTGSTFDHPITSGSSLVPLNDQDKIGGGLQASQMLHGKLADFQMWDRAMSNDEVRALGCYEIGNLVTFKDFDTVGFGNFKTGGKFYCTP